MVSFWIVLANLLFDHNENAGYWCFRRAQRIIRRRLKKENELRKRIEELENRYKRLKQENIAIKEKHKELFKHFTLTRIHDEVEKMRFCNCNVINKQAILEIIDKELKK